MQNIEWVTQLMCTLYRVVPKDVPTKTQVGLQDSVVGLQWMPPFCEWQGEQIWLLLLLTH
jgi:hypothetical protein